MLDVDGVFDDLGSPVIIFSLTRLGTNKPIILLKCFSYQNIRINTMYSAERA